MTRKNELHDRFSDLSRKYFIPSYVHDYPLIHTSHSILGVRSQLGCHMLGRAPTLNNTPLVL